MAILPGTLCSCLWSILTFLGSQSQRTSKSSQTRLPRLSVYLLYDSLDTDSVCTTIGSLYLFVYWSGNGTVPAGTSYHHRALLVLLRRTSFNGSHPCNGEITVFSTLAGPAVVPARPQNSSRWNGGILTIDVNEQLNKYIVAKKRMIYSVSGVQCATRWMYQSYLESGCWICHTVLHVSLSVISLIRSSFLQIRIGGFLLPFPAGWECSFFIKPFSKSTNNKQMHANLLLLASNWLSFTLLYLLLETKMTPTSQLVLVAQALDVVVTLSTGTPSLIFTCLCFYTTCNIPMKCATELWVGISWIIRWNYSTHVRRDALKLKDRGTGSNRRREKLKKQREEALVSREGRRPGHAPAFDNQGATAGSSLNLQHFQEIQFGPRLAPCMRWCG